MTKQELLKFIKEGEGLKIEFKQRFSTYKKIAKELIAFANTRGGYLIFGVDDDKAIYGVESEKGEVELIKQTAIKYCEPPITFDVDYFEIDNKEIVGITIPESDYKPHRLQDYQTQLNLNNALVYIRVNDKSIPASKEMIKLLQTNSSGKILKKYEIGENEKVVFKYLDKNRVISVKELMQIANLSHRRASRTLIKLVRANLLLIHTKDNGKDYFTYAGE